jgi:hypothetical protein
MNTGSVRTSVPKPRTDSFTSGPAGLFKRVGDAEHRAAAPAALEHAQDVARLGDLPARQREKAA